MIEKMYFDFKFLLTKMFESFSFKLIKYSVFLYVPIGTKGKTVVFFKGCVVRGLTDVNTLFCPLICVVLVEDLNNTSMALGNESIVCEVSAVIRPD